MPKIDLYIEKLSRESYRNLINYITSLPDKDIKGVAIINGGYQNEFPRAAGDLDYRGIKLEIFSELIEGNANKITNDLMNIIITKK